MNAAQAFALEYSMIKFTKNPRHPITGTDLSVRFFHLGASLTARIYRGKLILATSDRQGPRDFAGAFYSAVAKLTTRLQMYPGSDTY